LKVSDVEKFQFICRVVFEVDEKWFAVVSRVSGGEMKKVVK
jgi:hypothetical protein